MSINLRRRLAGVVARDEQEGRKSGEDGRCARRRKALRAAAGDRWREEAKVAAGVVHVEAQRQRWHNGRRTRAKKKRGAIERVEKHAQSQKVRVAGQVASCCAASSPSPARPNSDKRRLHTRAHAKPPAAPNPNPGAPQIKNLQPANIQQRTNNRSGQQQPAAKETFRRACRIVTTGGDCSQPGTRCFGELKPFPLLLYQTSPFLLSTHRAWRTCCRPALQVRRACWWRSTFTWQGSPWYFCRSSSTGLAGPDPSTRSNKKCRARD